MKIISLFNLFLLLFIGPTALFGTIPNTPIVYGMSWLGLEFGGMCLGVWEVILMW